MAFIASQLAMAAATTLAKKTFEFSITSSLKGLSDVIQQRFSNSKALQEAQAELEMKVKMLCLPIDILAHRATQGNTALQEPLGVALGVLAEVEAFRQALVHQDVARAQDAAASPDANAAQLVRRLRDLIARLDSLLPYLTLAIATITLLNQGSPNPASASRLMAASWRLRSCAHSGGTAYALPRAAWHEERQLTAAGPSMAEVFRLCSLAVRRCSGRDGGTAGGAEGGATHEGWAYELSLQQELRDGAYHEPEESAACVRLQISDILALQCETTQSLNQGDNEYRPALVLHMLAGGGGSSSAADGKAGGGGAGSRPGPDTPASAGGGKQPQASGGGGTVGGRKRAEQEASGASPLLVTPAAPGGGGRPGGGGMGGSIRRCAIMCSFPADASGSDAGSCSGSEEEEEEEEAGSDAGGSDACGPAASAAAASAALRREWRLLGELEYVLRLCILECREQAAHQDVSDERIHMCFHATAAPAAAAAAAASFSAASPAGAAAQAVEELAAGVRQLSFASGGGAAGPRRGSHPRKAGFGSPVQ